MAVTKDQKAEILKDLQESMKNTKAVYFAKNLGMSVTDSQEMRRALRAGGSTYRVAKKTLIRKSAKDTLNIEVDGASLEGAVGAAFSNEDELGAIKIIAKFAKDTEKIEIVGGIFEGKAITKEEAIALSKIPSRDELLAKLLGSLQAPISGFVGVGSQIVGGFVRVVNAYKEQKESAS